MATIEIPKVRKESTVIMYVSLTDNGVTVDWTSLSEIKPFMYSDEQHCIAGKCTAEIATGAPETLIVRYPTTAPQFLGQNSLLIRCTYDGNEKSFDVPVLEFVDRSSEATGVTVIEDPELPVAIEVQDVDTSVLDDAIAAALDAAAKATAAAELVPLDILAQCQAAAEAATAAAENASPRIAQNGNWEIYDFDEGEYVDSGNPSRGIQGVQGEKGDKGDKGDQGNTGSSVAYPYELVNNLTTDDATKGLSAAQGVALAGEISQLDQKVTPIFDTFVEGYITYTGAVDNSSNFRRSEPVYLPQGAVLAFRASGYSTTVAMLSRYEPQDEMYFPVIISADGDVHDFSYTVPSSGYFVISYRNADGLTYELTAPGIWDSIGSITNKLNDYSVVFVDGKYITLNGGVGTTVSLSSQSWSSAYRYAVVPCAEGDRFIVTGTGGDAPRLWAFLDSDNKIISVAGASASLTAGVLVAPANTAKAVFNDSLKTGAFVRYGVSKVLDGIIKDTNNLSARYGGGSYIPVLGQGTTGKYIDSGGAEQSSSGFTISAPIFVPAGGTLYAKAAGYSTNVAMIAKYDSASGLYYPKAVSVDSTLRTYSALSDGGYYVVSYHTSDGLEVSMNMPDIWPFVGSISDKVDGAEISWVNGKYITLNGGIGTVAAIDSTTWASGYRYAVVPCKAGDTFVLNGTGGDAPRLWAFLDENNVILSASAANSTGVNLLLVAPVGAAKLALNDSVKTGENRKLGAADAFAVIGSECQENIFAAFDNIFAFGDSLTASQVYTSADGTREARRTYPEVLAGLSGNTATTVAEGGATASYMWAHYADSIVQKDNAVAVLYLGTNGGLTDTVATDAAGSDPANWAENNTGDYCRIVNKMKTAGYKVLLLRPWTSSGTLADTIAAINDIAEKFGVAVMDAPSTRETRYHLWPNGGGQNSVHLNDIGYAVFAQRLAAQVSQLGDTMLARIFPA